MSNDNSLSEWEKLMRQSSERSLNERQFGRIIMGELDKSVPLNENAQKIFSIVARANDLMLSATQTRGVKSEEDANSLRESITLIRNYLNGLQETVTLDWEKDE